MNLLFPENISKNYAGRWLLNFCTTQYAGAALYGELQPSLAFCELAYL